MSLIDYLLNRTLCVGLSPTRLACVIRKGEAFLQEGAYQQNITDADGGWQVAIAALEVYLQQPERPSRGLPISVMLSSKWCHMMMVPWSVALLKPETASQFLQEQFIATYGDEARGWAISTDDAPYGAPRAACAIEKELLESITQLAKEHRHSCRHVEPAVSMALRCADTSRKAGFTAFAVVDAGRLNLIVTRRGRINRIQCQALDHDCSTELARSWQRWTLRQPELAEIAEVGVIDLTGELKSGALSEIFKPVLLPTYGLSSDYSLAFCGRAG